MVCSLPHKERIMTTQMTIWGERSQTADIEAFRFQIEEAKQKLDKVYRSQTGLFKRLQELKRESQEIEGILEDLISSQLEKELPKNLTLM